MDQPAGPTSLHVAAEFGGSALLDRAHCTALDASEVTVTVMPVCFAVATENIRHLQSRRHGEAGSA